MQSNVEIILHTANSVKQYARENEIELIFAPIYSPEFQPSESLIGFLKQYVKKKRLQNLFSDKEQTFEQMLKEAKKKDAKAIADRHIQPERKNKRSK